MADDVIADLAHLEHSLKLTFGKYFLIRQFSGNLPGTFPEEMPDQEMAHICRSGYADTARNADSWCWDDGLCSHSKGDHVGGPERCFRIHVTLITNFDHVWSLQKNDVDEKNVTIQLFFGGWNAPFWTGQL